MECKTECFCFALFLICFVLFFSLRFFLLTRFKVTFSQKGMEDIFKFPHNLLVVTFVNGIKISIQIKKSQLFIHTSWKIHLHSFKTLWILQLQAIRCCCWFFFSCICVTPLSALCFYAVFTMTSIVCEIANISENYFCISLFEYIVRGSEEWHLFSFLFVCWFVLFLFVCYLFGV